MSESLSWQEPWDALPQHLHRAYQSQLKHELVPGHSLFGHPCTILGKKVSSDDILIALADGQVAVVHLTWGGPGDDYYPGTTFFSDWDDFVAKCMEVDARDYR